MDVPRVHATLSGSSSGEPLSPGQHHGPPAPWSRPLIRAARGPFPPPFSLDRIPTNTIIMAFGGDDLLESGEFEFVAEDLQVWL